MSNRKRKGSSQRAKNFRIDVECLESRLLLAADTPVNDSLVLDQNTPESVPVVTDTRSLEVNLGPLQLLPGDTAIGAADGHQINPEIAQGGNQYLAVWADYRTSPEDHPGTFTEGLGADIYGIIMDASGNPVSETPLVINQEFGDQESAAAAWNGQNWLVAWRSPTLSESPTYERIMAARVAPDGTVLDETPIELHNDGAYYDSWPMTVASDGQDWVVVFKVTGGSGFGQHAIRVAADGTLPVTTTTRITNSASFFDVAFAGDRYLFTWQETPGFPGRGRLYTTDLQPTGASFSLPGAELVASDGTDFMVNWFAREPGAWYTLKGIKVNHDGTRPNPSGFEIQVMQYRSSFPQLVWDGEYYWSTWHTGAQYATTRIDTAGTVLDPGGAMLGNFGLLGGTVGAIGGGMQMTWHDGGGAAFYPKDVYTSHISSTAQVESPVLLSSGAPAQLHSDFAAGPDMFAVAFESRFSGNTSIKVQRLDAHGAALDAEPIEIASGPDVSGAGVAYDGTRYMVTWRDNLSVFAQRMATDGTLLGQPIEVMTTWTGRSHPFDRAQPDVAGIDGTFLVVGADFVSNDENSLTTFTRRIDGATGALLDVEAQPIPSSYFSSRPHVVAFGNRWLLYFQTHLSHDSPIISTNASFVDLDGTSTGIGVGLGWRPAVAVSGDRALFVAISDTYRSAHADIEGRIMLADGTFLGPEFTISEAPDKQLYPTATFDGENFLVAWQDKRDSEFYYDERTDIYGTRVSPDGEVLDFDAGGFGGIAMTSTPQPERDAALITAGGTTLFATSTFIADREYEAYRLGIAEVTADLRGDFNGDQSVNAADIDMLSAEINNGTHAPLFDLTGDGLVNSLDMDELVLNILGTLYGDANLDRFVDGLDFIQWNENRFQGGGWLQGDFNGDAIVDGNDFILWNENKFQTGTGGLRLGTGQSLSTNDARAPLAEHDDDSPESVTSQPISRLLAMEDTMSRIAKTEQQLAAWQSQRLRDQMDTRIPVGPELEARESSHDGDLAGQLDHLKRRLQFD